MRRSTKPAKGLATLDVRSRQQWRKWLQTNHRWKSEIWLVFHKQHTGTKSISYDDAVEEALCFGWIDSIVRRLDEDRYARKFTRRAYIIWIDSAKREETKAKRLREAISLLAAGEKLGLK